MLHVRPGGLRGVVREDGEISERAHYNGDDDGDGDGDSREYL